MNRNILISIEVACDWVLAVLAAVFLHTQFEHAVETAGLCHIDPGSFGTPGIGYCNPIVAAILYVTSFIGFLIIAPPTVLFLVFAVLTGTGVAFAQGVPFILIAIGCVSLIIKIMLYKRPLTPMLVARWAILLFVAYGALTTGWFH